MPRHRCSYLLVLLMACQSGRLAQGCPTPAASATGLSLATQLLLRRGPDLGPGAAEVTLNLTASGDALYTGGPGVPVPGQFMGRMGADRFQSLLSRLVRAGLTLSPTDSALSDPAGQCGRLSVISLSVQTADGQYLRQVFCAASPTEARLADPIYRAAEEIRWQPGARTLSLQRGP